MNFLQLLQKCPEFTCGVHRDLTGSAGILTNNKTQIGAVEIANDAGNLTNFCHGHGNHGLYDIAGSGAVGGAHQGEHIVERLRHYSKLRNVRTQFLLVFQNCDHLLFRGCGFEIMSRDDQAGIVGNDSFLYGRDEFRLVAGFNIDDIGIAGLQAGLDGSQALFLCVFLRTAFSGNPEAAEPSPLVCGW